MSTNSAFQDQVAIITGGADGLGRALAERLQAAGAQLALLDINPEKLNRAREELGGSPATFVTDVSSAADVQSAFDAIAGKFGRIDILVNSAGITGKTNTRSHEVPVEDFDRVLALNLRGTFLTCQAALPRMLERGYGRILNIASIAGKEDNAGIGSYSASKAGVTVNALAPAVIRTAMVDALPTEQVDYMTAKIPMRRCGTLDEIANVAAFIVSRENSFTTGFCYDLSGGRAVC